MFGLLREEMNILGAIIAGGQSRRMAGANKLLLELNGEYLVARAARKLSQHVDQVVINLQSEEKTVASLGYPIILDEQKDHLGPLAGISSVLKWVANSGMDIDYVMTVPADAPFFPTDLVNKLKAAIGSNDIAIAHYDGYSQQLFGLWSVKCSDDLSEYLDDPDNRKVMTFIRSQNWVQVEIQKQDVDPFMNINTQEDWQLAQSIPDKDGAL